MRILTNHPGQAESETWQRASTYLGVKGAGYLPVIKNVVQMHLKKNRYSCVVLGAGRADMLFLLINTLLCRFKTKCILIDCLWSASENKLYHAMKKLMFKIIDCSVSKYVVWASRERETYSAAFSLPKDKLVFIPYHHTINGIDIRGSYGDYLFSGGSSGRDYVTLIESVRGLPVKLVIACTNGELFEGLDIPDNVVIEGFNHREYLEKMAGCRINIVALAPNQLHSAGQQTFLNSMFLGKPTIVLDPEGAADYIDHGIDGLLVEPGNPQMLRKAILSLLEDPEESRRIGSKARQRAMLHSTEAHFQKIVSVAKEVVVAS